jgi:hypothetical protein
MHPVEKGVQPLTLRSTGDGQGGQIHGRHWPVLVATTGQVSRPLAGDPHDPLTLRCRARCVPDRRARRRTGPDSTGYDQAPDLHVWTPTDPHGRCWRSFPSRGGTSVLTSPCRQTRSAPPREWREARAAADAGQAGARVAALRGSDSDTTAEEPRQQRRQQRRWTPTISGEQTRTATSPLTCAHAHPRMPRDSRGANFKTAAIGL